MTKKGILTTIGLAVLWPVPGAAILYAIGEEQSLKGKDSYLATYANNIDILTGYCQQKIEDRVTKRRVKRILEQSREESK